jgi:hypothetical protein
MREILIQIKMKKLKILLSILLIGLIVSCETDITENIDDNTSNLQNKDFKIHKLETEYNFDTFSEEDQLKITMGESLENLLISDKEYAREFLTKLIDHNKTKEFLYAEKKGIFSNKTLHSKNSKKSLESLLIENIDNSSALSKGNNAERQKRISLIQRAENILPNLVIKIPDWANVILENIDPEKLDYAVYSGINTKDLSFQRKRETSKIAPSSTISDYIPIQVKESEKLIPLRRGTDKTLWNNDLINDNFPSLKDCDNFNKEDYITYRSSEYDFIDKMRLNEDLVNAELCGIDINDKTDNSNSSCTKVYQRDCVTEKNVIEGFKFANYSVFKGANNQPGGEDVLTLHYVFVASQMCGDTSVSKDCPPTTWKLVFHGDYNRFFENQFHWGEPTSEELADVIYTRNTFWMKYYVKAVPRYYDIPVDFSAEGIYSQAAYLQNTQNGTWDGNVYGTVVSYSVYEHDDVVVKSTQTESVTVTNTTKVSAKLKLREKFNAGSDFSNTVTRTSSHTYTIEAAKDVELGQSASVYFDQNFDNEVLFGINKASGSINTHFAFYY